VILSSPSGHLAGVAEKVTRTLFAAAGCFPARDGAVVMPAWLRYALESVIEILAMQGLLEPALRVLLGAVLATARSRWSCTGPRPPSLRAS